MQQVERFLCRFVITCYIDGNITLWVLLFLQNEVKKISTVRLTSM